MKRYEVKWSELRLFDCYLEVEAESEDEARFIADHKTKYDYESDTGIVNWAGDFKVKEVKEND